MGEKLHANRMFDNSHIFKRFADHVAKGTRACSEGILDGAHKLMLKKQAGVTEMST